MQNASEFCHLAKRENELRTAYSAKSSAVQSAEIETRCVQLLLAGTQPLFNKPTKLVIWVCNNTLVLVSFGYSPDLVRFVYSPDLVRFGEGSGVIVSSDLLVFLSLSIALSDTVCCRFKIPAKRFSD